jgi:radical SAM protein with 4Fe4S-binding SPASM domain
VIVYVKPTDSCNLNCSHCFTGGSTVARNAWDLNANVSWIRDAVVAEKANDLHVELHGGEPFLVGISELSRFSSELRDNIPPEVNLTIGATTNLIYKLTDEHIKFIQNDLGSRIATSYDPVHRFKNQQMFALWLYNIKKLKEHNITVKLFVTTTKELIAIEPSSLIDLLSTFDVDEVAVERLTANGNAIDNREIFPDNRDIDNYYYDLYFEYKKRNPQFNIVTLDTIEGKFKTRKFDVDTNCRTCEKNLFTPNADGTIAGCANGAREEASGSVHRSATEYLASTERLERMTKEVDRDVRCYDCNLYDVCLGDCHRLSWQGDSCPGLKRLLTYFKYGNIIPIKEID